MGRGNKGASTNVLYIVSDILFGCISFVVSALITGIFAREDWRKYFVVAVIFMLIYILSNKESRIYNVTTFFYIDRVLKHVTKSILIATTVTSTLLFYIGNAAVDGRFYVIYLVVTYICVIISAMIMRILVKSGNVFAPRTLMIGGYEHFEKFNNYLHKSNTEVDIIGYVSVKPEDKGKSEYIGCIEDLEEIIKENNIDQVYIMHRKSVALDMVQEYISMCMEMGVTMRIIMDSYRAGAAQSYVSSVGTYPVITYHTVSLNMSERAIKRAVDIVGSLAGIILTSPIMLVTAIAIKIDSKGPVIFKQQRVGMNGRHFNIYKFRSMCNDAESLKKKLMDQNEMEGEFMFKMQDDPRITRVGKFIRKTSIDELPQFFNVLIGNMSLVGTRPPTIDEVDKYERNHWRRISIKPGITGMWQVSGRSSITDFAEIVSLDTEYIDKWNVLLDFRIMIKTVLQIFTRKGAF
ncbi:MAG: sugar transferase [Lachnospiraceae bacterium]|nr:sugar transferase [Lachnospiraceae bacterium]